MYNTSILEMHNIDKRWIREAVQCKTHCKTNTAYLIINIYVTPTDLEMHEFDKRRVCDELLMQKAADATLYFTHRTQ